MHLFIYLGKACRLRATTALCKRFKSPLEADAHFSQQLSSPSSDSVMDTGVTVVDQSLVVSKQQQTDECLKFFASLENDDQLRLLTELFSRHFPSVKSDFLPLIIDSMKYLRKCNRTNVIYTLARVVGTPRPDGTDSLLPVKRMPFGLLEYTINFFGATSTQKVLLLYCA